MSQNLHITSGEDKLDLKKKDKAINLSDFLSELCTLNHVLRYAKSVRSK